MLNRIAAAQNYTTKEGFSMRSVALKALAVLVGLAVLMIAAPWFSETVQGQQVIAQVTINGTCNQAITIGTPTTITVAILSINPPGATANFQLRLRGPQTPPDGRVFGQQELAGLGQGAVVNFQGQAAAPPGWRTITLERLLDPGGQFAIPVAFCSYQVVDGPGQQPGQQVQLTIQARDNRPLQIPMELTINPPTGGWMGIVTPYSQNFPQNTRIQLVAPERVDGLQFDHWEYPRDPWRPECNFGLTRNILTGPLCFLQTTITAVYRRSEQQPTPPPQLVEYLVSVLYTTWENNIMADPPMARVQVLQGSPNGQPGQVLEFAWIRHPAQAHKASASASW